MERGEGQSTARLGTSKGCVGDLVFHLQRNMCAFIHKNTFYIYLGSHSISLSCVHSFLQK